MDLVKEKISVIILLIAVISFGCIQNKKDEINGYWIEAGYSVDREFTTLYIDDSMFVENPFGVYRYENYISHEDTLHEVSYPSDSGYPPIKITFRDDTLTLENWFQNKPSKFTRINAELLKTDLTFSENPITIKLPNNSGDSEIDERLFGEFLFVGKLKKGNYPTHPGIHPDSILIQLFDVFIALNEIPEVVRMAKAKVDEFDRDGLIICLYADVNTPDYLIEEIDMLVKANGLRTARAYINPAVNEICFKFL